MKRFLTMLAAVCCLTFASYAQTAELQFSYGGYTQQDAMDMHDGWHGVNTSWGGITGAVNFRVAPRMWLGPSYTFSSTTTKGGPEHSSIAYHTLMLNFRYHYWSNSIVSLYAHGALGVDLSYMQPHMGDNYTKAYCAFQISPLGANVSLSRNFAMFGELGFGAQGLVQAGVRILL